MSFYKSINIVKYYILPVSVTVLTACTTCVSILDDVDVLICVESISSVI
jgi:hypothetical protein